MLAGVLFAYTRHHYVLFFMAWVVMIQWRLLPFFLFLLAFTYALMHQWWVLSELPTDADMLQARVIGSIHSVPTQSFQKKQFYFKTEAVNGKKVNAMLFLSSYEASPEFQAGERWQFQVKLKKPHNLGNPGAFDYAQWLSSRHVQWTGYVKKNSAILLTARQTKGFSLLHVREEAGKLLHKMAPDVQSASILQALSLGLTGEIEKNLWDLFRRTGTTHLMVISGAHIGLVAALVFALTKWLWRRNAFLCLYWPAVKAASMVSFFAALAYALLAGFAVPVQRALIGCFFVSLHYLGDRKYTIWQVWRYALFFVVLIEPHSVLMPGFYLSFIAVAVIIIACQRWPLKGIGKIFLVQSACLIGLMPLSIYWFSYGSVIGFIANLFAIPWVAFCIVPLALFMLLLLPFASSALLMKPLAGAVHLLLKLLCWVDALSFLNFSLSFAQMSVPLSLMAAILCLVLLPLRSYQVLTLVLILSALFPPHQKLKEGELLLNVLDVAQGLSVVVQTKNHVLIYDTGDRFYQGSDMAQLAILPFLRIEGVKYLDKVVISHPDKDHQGGLASLEAALPVGELIVSDRGHYQRGSSCHDYPPWQWDGIEFRFFSSKNQFKEKNNRSCILQIRHPDGRILLTGDIEKKAEAYLRSQYAEQLRSDILLVPHHGSKTSSSSDFLGAVKPKYAIASLGYGNRFRFPHAEVVRRYAQLNIPLLQTKDCGMVTVKLTADSKDREPICYKKI